MELLKDHLENMYSYSLEPVIYFISHFCISKKTQTAEPRKCAEPKTMRLDLKRSTSYLKTSKSKLDNSHQRKNKARKFRAPDTW